jgi:hypothetical protein
MEENVLVLIGMVVAFWLGMYASLKLAQRTLARNRSEWTNFEKSGRVSPEVIDWLVAQMRDDIGGIYTMLVIANGLLAAIAAGIAIYLIR